MFLGYNTNGFAHHRLEEAISILADLGYRGVGLTLDVHHLDPFAPDLLARTAAIRKQLERHRMSCVIESGARFLLDSRRKHEPTLISPTMQEREVRQDFLRLCVDIGAELNAQCISFWSGKACESSTWEEQMEWLVKGCQQVAEYAERKHVLLAFEPEPGMLIDSMERFAELYERVKHASFGLTIDVGHLVCGGELPVSRFLTEWKQVLWNIHIEDMKRGVHDHVMFGQGEIDFEDTFAGLNSANYDRGVYVELSRHSHEAVQTAQKAKAFLDQVMRSL